MIRALSPVMIFFLSHFSLLLNYELSPINLIAIIFFETVGDFSYPLLNPVGPTTSIALTVEVLEVHFKIMTN